MTTTPNNLPVPTPLSPAAQTVMDAYLNAPCGAPRRAWVAAALRAAADQADPKTNIKDISYTHQNCVDGWKDALDVILAIATELGGHQ